jgi:cytochrome c oxidase subunit 2
VRRGARLLALAAGAMALSGCSVGRLGLPQGITDRTEAILDLWYGEWIAAGVIGVAVFLMIMWSVLRYRRRDDDFIPEQGRYNLPIEVLYTVAPIIVIAALFFHTVETQGQIDEESETPDHVITVIGQKWGWTFVYENEESLGGDIDVFDIGTPENLAELTIPVGESVRFELKSQDVIHSFWVPEFYYKMDVFPGRNDNAFEVTPTVEGDFRGRCAELCGTYHSRMLFDLHVVSPEEYEQHLAELADTPTRVGTPDVSSQTVDIEGYEQ